MRLRVVGKVPEIGLPKAMKAPWCGAPSTTRSIYWNGAYQDAPSSAGDLGHGSTVEGPAIVEQEDTTVLVLAGWRGAVDEIGNLILRKDRLVTLFILRRVLDSLVVIWAISVIVFFGVHLIGNPIDLLVGPDCAQACRAEAGARLGLDRPIWEQYFTFVSNLLKGDLGRSYTFGVPAFGIVLERLPATLELAVFAMVMAIAIGFPLGLWAGLRRKSVTGRLIMALSVLGFSIPTFWIGILLIIVFAVQLGLLPVTGRGETAPFMGIQLAVLTFDGFKHLLSAGCDARTLQDRSHHQVDPQRLRRGDADRLYSLRARQGAPAQAHCRIACDQEHPHSDRHGSRD